MKKQIKVKEPIRLRTKKLSNGNESLYLDIYTDGKRDYEFLKLYIIQERTKEDKEKNAQTLKLANAIKSKRIVELQNEEHGFRTSSVKSKANIINYIDSFVENLPKDTKGYNGYICTMQGLKYHLSKYKGENITFKDIDRKFLAGFTEYLKVAKVSTKAVKESDRTLAQGTQWNYFNKLNLLLNNYIDFEEGVTALDLFAGTGSISIELVSRGCDRVISVEKEPAHYSFICKIMKEVQTDKCLPIRGDVFKFINNSREQFDFIFADPPYALKELETIPELIFKNNLLKEDGLFVLEHGKDNNFEENPHFIERRVYGSVNFSLFR